MRMFTSRVPLYRCYVAFNLIVGVRKLLCLSFTQHRRRPTQLSAERKTGELLPRGGRGQVSPPNSPRPRKLEGVMFSRLVWGIWSRRMAKHRYVSCQKRKLACEMSCLHFTYRNYAWNLPKEKKRDANFPLVLFKQGA